MEHNLKRPLFPIKQRISFPKGLRIENVAGMKIFQIFQTFAHKSKYIFHFTSDKSIFHEMCSVIDKWVNHILFKYYKHLGII